ncbi:uncharacterized protein LOC118321035 isoform X2 [Morone saxatilis]|uniref:uncharacterized protein LOC118321035 isoform X2 n=1 Tax=Morone saxatilis TaxID=34816 RepID=UPI0015E1CD2E|nr:uncharacterized protein LOC118321035 isoform X2 [Morone saxatilis]
MSRTDCFRLFGLCLWLLVGDVNCENAQKGYVRRVQAGQAPMGVQNKNRVYKSSAVQVPSHIYRARTKPVQAPKHPQESPLTPRSEVGGYRPAYVFPNSFNRGRTDLLQKVLKPVDKKMDSIEKGHSPGRNSAGKVDTRMSSSIWSHRVYSSDGMSKARVYAHVRHLKPGGDRIRPQSTFAACTKFLGADFTSPKKNQGSYSRDLTVRFGHGVQASNERWLNLDQNSRRREPGSWHRPPPDRAHIPVQGKFKPFQRLPTNDLHAQTNSSDSETAPTQTTLPPSLTSTGITSSVNEKFSTETALPTQTEGRDAELVPQASNPEGQSESSAEVGTSLKQNELFSTTVSPPKLQPAEKETS